jgi:hypothetical protein
MEKDEETVLPHEESLRMAAIDLALRISSRPIEEVLSHAGLIYKFLKSGEVPEKDQDNGKLQLNS